MSLTVPLAVRVVTTRSDRHITRELRDLTFREVAVGGFASATFRLDRPVSLPSDELAYFARVYIYDAQSGATVWEGRLEDPGSGSGADGQVWQLTAMGPSAHASDRTIPLIYVDSSVNNWIIGDISTKHVNVDIGGRDDARIFMQCPAGSPFATSEAGYAAYQPIFEAGQKLARVTLDWDAGLTTVNNEMRLGTAQGTGATNTPDSASCNVAGGSLSAIRGGSPAIPAGDDVVRLRFIRINSDLPATSEIYWGEFFNIVVRAIIKTTAGVDRTSGYSSNTIRADQVVEDLLGRLLVQYDGPGATVTQTSYAIDQLCYPDGVTAAEVLDDLMELEPAYRWGAYESNADGLYRFEWVAWPSTVRYEADILDGFDSPASAQNLFNQVRVRYRDSRGIVRSVNRTSTVQVLTDAGVTRGGFIDLGDDVGSAGNANQAGDQFLAEHGTAESAGIATIARPIYDLIDGRMVQPWEIRAGQLIRFRRLHPRVDALSAAGRDGMSTFKIAAKEYQTSTASAELELDTYPLSTARALAKLNKKVKASRRR